MMSGAARWAREKSARRSHTDKDQRAAVDDLIRKVDRDELQLDTEESYLDQDASGRQAFFKQLVETIESLRTAGSSSVDVLEQELYEQWINTHFEAIGEDASGCIEYRFEYDDNTFDFVSCTVEAPFGDKVERALSIASLTGASS